MEMQCELLISDFDDPKTIALVKETIEQLSEGPYCASALKLWLKMGFERRRQKAGVLLRCTNSSCSTRRSEVSYSSVESHIRCQMCRPPAADSLCYYLQCAGCSTVRISACASCAGCGKRFI